jgi:hypothetical protein
MYERSQLSFLTWKTVILRFLVVLLSLFRRILGYYLTIDPLGFLHILHHSHICPSFDTA